MTNGMSLTVLKTFMEKKDIREYKKDLTVSNNLMGMKTKENYIIVGVHIAHPICKIQYTRMHDRHPLNQEIYYTSVISEGLYPFNQ